MTQPETITWANLKKIVPIQELYQGVHITSLVNDPIQNIKVNFGPPNDPDEGDSVLAPATMVIPTEPDDGITPWRSIYASLTLPPPPPEATQGITVSSPNIRNISSILDRPSEPEEGDMSVVSNKNVIMGPPSEPDEADNTFVPVTDGIANEPDDGDAAFRPSNYVTIFSQAALKTGTGNESDDGICAFFG